MKTPGHSLISLFFLTVILCAQLMGATPMAVAGEGSVLVDESGISLDDDIDGKDSCGLISGFCFAGAARQGQGDEARDAGFRRQGEAPAKAN